MQQISLYIHIPFCAKKCRYCDFYSVTYENSRANSYLASLAREITLLKKQKVLTDSTVITTVYFGGGTPSALSADQLATLCGLVRETARVAPGAEWSVECNPESFTRDKARVLLDLGVTRLTFGLQSFDDEELSFLGRVHDAARCREILAHPALARFRSAGIDLIYGLPGQTAAFAQTSLAPVLKSPYVKHISAYELTLAENTPLGRHRSLLPLPGDDDMAALTRWLWEILELNGFEQYEVSNFAKAGHRCLHNEAYWDHAPYLGLGCAAHSYLPPRRFANIKDINRYSAMLESGELPRAFSESIDAKKLAAEMIFLGLRRCAGINEETFEEKCGFRFAEFVNKGKLSVFNDQGLLVYEKPRWKPTKRGLLMADAMTRHLL